MKTLRRVLALMVKEFAMILKDPKSRFIVIGPPILQFFVFGYAATYDVKNVRTAVLNESRGALSRQLLARVDGSDTFELTHTLLSENDIDEVINLEKARILIHIGPDFDRNIESGIPAEVQLIADGRNPNAALVALGYFRNILEEFNQDLAARGMMGNSGPGLAIVQRAWFNDNLQSRWFMVSALGGVICMVVVMILTSLSVAREREFGTFDQLLVAPFTPGEILIGKSLPGMTFGFMNALIFSAGAVWWFEVPFRGTLPALVLALLCFIVTMVGVGLLVSSLSMTMQQGLLGSFVVMMPSVILSGLATPIENMPHWLQVIDTVNPVQYIIVALRNIFLQGADTAMIWPQLWPLLIIAGISLPSAAWLFRHRTQ